MSTTTFQVQETRRQLHDIIREDVPFDKKAGDALEVGAEYLGATHGYLVQINQETRHYEVVVATEDIAGQGLAGPEVKPAEIFCREILEEQATVGLHNDSAEELRTEPIIKRGEEHWYIDVPIVLDHELYGTVCFVGDESPSVATDSDFLFADHLARLLERELARNQVQSKLSNQSNLATVLNRVLRHNLRNDMSVIRGYSQAIADQVDDKSNVETILKHIDNLLDLSEKARKLEEVLSAGSERQPTDITSLSTQIADEVSRDYPDASIAVEYDDEIQTSVMPTFRRALEELITNAVKHAESDPTVTVTVETVSNAVEIRIKDNGPGLPEEEQKVLESGAEDPLVHGSGLGLWIAHWIVTSHDGSIDTTVMDQGTAMTVSIPQKSTVGVQQQLLDLTRSRDKYKAAFEGANDAITIVDDEGRILEANGAAGEIFGMEIQEVIGRTLTEFLPDEFEFDSEWRNFQQTGNERDTVTVIGADGEERVIEYSAIADIIPGQHLFVIRDMSERVERERELAEKTRQLEAIVQSTSEAIYIKDAEGYYQFINESGARLFGHTPEEIVGKHDEDLFDPESAAEIRADDRQIMESGEEMAEETNRYIDGERHVFLDNKYPYRDQDGEIIGIIGISPDITGQKEREKQLRTRTRAIEKAPIGITLSDPNQSDNPMVYANKCFCELTGYEESEILGRNCRFMQGPETDPESVAEIRTAIDNEEPVTTVLRNYRKDGTMFWNRLTIAPVKDEGGDVNSWIGFQDDVTERIEREQQLKLAETVFENTQDALFVVDVTDDDTFRVQRVNEVYEQLTGISNAEIAGKTPTEVVGEEIGGEIESHYRDCVERRETIQYFEEIPVDGEPRQWETKVTPIIDEGSVETLVGAMRDVTGIQNV